MRLASIDLDIEKGTLILTDHDGRSANYRRLDEPFNLTVLHAICGPTGCMAMTALLEADTFPDELFIKHDSPQQPPQAPVGMVMKWAGEFRYVRDKGSDGQAELGSTLCPRTALRMREDNVRSITDQIRVRVEGIKQDARQLFTAHSVIRPHRDDRFSSLVVIRMGSHGWGELPVEGERLASKLREEYDRLAEVLRVLLRSQDRRTLQELEQGRKRLRQWIDQSGDHSFKTGQEAADAFAKELDEQFGLLEKLYDWREGEHIYVPDTNALIFHPKIEDWSFDESPRFTLVVMPTVLAELDKHKVNDRNPAVRDKAKQLVRQLMEYRRRGSLASGVVIRKDRITLRTLAVEPDFESTLSWLDRANDDDRILAGFIEVLRQHPRCPVFLVTGDINLTNKADYAGLPCVPPPEPTVAVPTA